VCDHGNVKVKAQTDRFTELLVKNGIKVYTERYSTHQPGYQVRAAALNSTADFFFQIHSKTAGSSHVRLFVNGQPNRMRMEDAVANIWSSWRAQCGALTRAEVDILPTDKVLALLSDFAQITPAQIDFTTLVKQGREIMDAGDDLAPSVDRLHIVLSLFQEAKSRIQSTRTIATEWSLEPGGVLQRCIPAPRISGLSTPLKEMLVSVIDQSIRKGKAVLAMFEQYVATSPIREAEAADEEDNLAEIPIDSDIPKTDVSSWRMMIESLDDDTVGSLRIASYGDTRQHIEDVPGDLFFLDDY
jgi:hypothetical protein